MARHRKKLPAWLLGLVLSVFIFAAALFLFSVLGFGDDPVVGSLGAALG
jgi:uncharacterized metal-binding protein